MPAALWQGDLAAALGAVVEDVDFRSAVSEGNQRGSHCSSYVSTLIENYWPSKISTNKTSNTMACLK
jgi:hypothetical protein